MATGKRPLVITDPTLLVRRANERLVMVRDRAVVAAVPIAEVAHVALHGPVTVTGAALAGLLDAGVEVTLYASAGRYRGTIVGGAAGNVYLVLAQADAWRREEKRVAFGRALVASKLAGQRMVVARHARDRGSARCGEAASRLAELEAATAGEATVDGLRGLEGVGAATYFDVFGEMLREGWTFPGRVRRPATDPVNALLGFGYTLAVGEIVRLLVAHGFDTRIGLVHGLRYGRESLALDLVEEFRAPLVDRFVLRLVNLRQLTPEDFEVREDGAVRLSDEPRRRFLGAWEELLAGPATGLSPSREEAPTDVEGASQRIERADVDDEDRGADAGDADGTTGPSWRARMEGQVLSLLGFLMKDEPYAPLVGARRRGRKPPREG